MRQQMVENGRIPGKSQVYLPLWEKDTCFQHKGNTVMKMMPEAFHTWSQCLQLSSETVALIASIRESPQVRRMSGGTKNSTERYPSLKTGLLGT